MITHPPVMSMNHGSPDTSFASSLRYVGTVVLIRSLHLPQDRRISVFMVVFVWASP